MLLTPKNIEAWLHRRRWAHRVIQEMHQADGIIVSHTKSGRTWLRVMISHVYHLEYAVPIDELIKFDNLHKLNPAIPRLFFFRDTSIPTFNMRGGSEPLPADRKTLFFIRDPRDVAVSFFFHVKNRASFRELDRKGITEADRCLELYDFVASEKLGVLRVIDHMNRWYNDMQQIPKSLIVRYEEMRSGPTDVLDRVMTFLDRRFDQTVIDSAVAFASFDSLSRKEADGFFKSDKLKPSDASDGDSYKVRRGKIGGYRDYFSDEQNAYIDNLVRDRLNPVYGYR
jgi:alcohol sulfotransferase